MRALMKVGFSLLILALLLIGVSYSMLRAQGTNGPYRGEAREMASETRKVGAGITTVNVNGPFDITLRQGAVPSLVIRGEQRLLGNIDTSQDGGILNIATTGMMLMHRQPLQVVLVLPSLENLNIHGSGDSAVNGFNGERINVQLYGSGHVKFNGRYKDVKGAVHGNGEMELNGGNSDRVEAVLMGSGEMTVVGASKDFKADKSGSGDLNARHLTAEEAVLTMHGSGDATLMATKAVNVTLRGSGNVMVHGAPSERNVSRTGSGEVTFED